MGGNFSVLEESDVYRGWVIRVAKGRFCDPDGNAFERDVVHHPGAVAVVPVDDAGNAILVSQFRAAAGGEVLEVPAGTCDVPGEARIVTARRELQEEVGLLAGRIEELATVYNSPGILDQVTTVYLATELTRCERNVSGPEERWMTIREVPLTTIDLLQRDSRAFAAVTLLGLNLARDVLNRRQSADVSASDASARDLSQDR